MGAGRAAKRHLLASAAGFLLIGASAAYAADPATSAAGFAQSPAPLSLNNFYIRGDVGGDFRQDTTFSDTNPTASNCSLCGVTFPVRIGNSVYFGGGVGYVINPMFRADLTLDDLPSQKVSGTSASVAKIAASTSLDSLLGLLNGYVDLKPFGSFQPYLMAGVGFASNDLGTFHGTVGAGPLAGTARTTSGSTQTNLALAAGAGVAYPLTQQLSFDLAYKFLYLGPLQTGTTVTAAGFSGQLTPSRSSDLYAHTITIGLRYTFSAH